MICVGLRQYVCLRRCKNENLIINRQNTLFGGPRASGFSGGISRSVERGEVAGSFSR